MCLKHYYKHDYCRHPADANLTWTKPCDEALNGQDYTRVTKFCDDKYIQTVEHTLRNSLCQMCAMNPENLLTEDRIAQKAAARERASQRHAMEMQKHRLWKAGKLSERNYIEECELRVPRQLRRRYEVDSRITHNKGDDDAVLDDWQSSADDAREMENKDPIPSDWQESADEVSDFRLSAGDDNHANSTGTESDDITRLVCAAEETAMRKMRTNSVRMPLMSALWYA